MGFVGQKVKRDRPALPFAIVTFLTRLRKVTKRRTLLRRRRADFPRIAYDAYTRKPALSRSVAFLCTGAGRNLRGKSLLPPCNGFGGCLR